MAKIFRFVYLNLYAFLLLFLGILAISIPFYRIEKFIVIPQILASILSFYYSAKLFSTWNYKKKEYKILMERNKNEFRPDTFKIFMDAPCGRLLTKVVLKDLGKKEEYKNLLKFKIPFFTSLKNSFIHYETKIYINEDYLKSNNPVSK